MPRYVWIAVILLVLPSCTWLGSRREPTVHKLRHYPLLPPSSYGRSFTAQHLLEGHARGRVFQLQVHIEIDVARIQVLGLTPWQTRVFVLSYDGADLQFKNFTLHELPFSPSHMLSDVQQVMWPALPNQGAWRVIEQTMLRQRQVYFQDQLVTHIQYNEGFPIRGGAELTSVQFGYQWRIHPFETES